MEAFLQAALIISIVIGLCINVMLFIGISTLIKKLENNEEKIDQLDQLLAGAKKPQEPMKPNNWDSVREAFKGPVRIEVNERN